MWSFGSPVIFDSNWCIKSCSRLFTYEHKILLKNWIWAAAHLCKHTNSLKTKIIVLFNVSIYAFIKLRVFCMELSFLWRGIWLSSIIGGSILKVGYEKLMTVQLLFRNSKIHSAYFFWSHLSGWRRFNPYLHIQFFLFC